MEKFQYQSTVVAKCILDATKYIWENITIIDKFHYESIYNMSPIQIVRALISRSLRHEIMTLGIPFADR